MVTVFAAAFLAGGTPPTLLTDPAPDFPGKPHPRLLNGKTCTGGMVSTESREIWHAAEHKSPSAPETGSDFGPF